MRSRAVHRPFAIPAWTSLTLATLPWLVLALDPVRAEPRVRVRAGTRIEVQADSLAGGAVVRGRLLDDQGSPLSGQSVEILRVGAAATRPRVVATDERGEFASEIEGAAPDSIAASYGGDELHTAASATVQPRTGRPAAAVAGRVGAERARQSARRSSFWLLVPIGICALVVLASRRYGRSEGSGGTPGPWPWRGTRWSTMSAPARTAATSPRARAAAAYRPAAMAVLPSAALWGHVTPRETLAHAAAARAGREPPELGALTERVERACYAPPMPDDAEVRAIAAAARRVAAALGRPVS